MAALIGGEGPGFAVAATCPRCAGALEHITSSRPTATEASAIVVCSECSEEWQVLVRLCVVPRANAARGTERKRASRARLREVAGA